MCGRFTLTASIEEVADKFKATINISNTDVARVFNEPLYNIAPGTYHPIVIQQDSSVIIKSMKWGLVPYWSKEPKIGYKMINARSESLSVKPSFIKPLQNQRCIIPASGFYEWKKLENSKQPYYFQLKKRPIFGFAGLYDKWVNGKNEELYTYTIITTTPNADVKSVHNRMPAILPTNSEGKWLDQSLNQIQHLELLRPIAEELDFYKVSNMVNSPSNNSSSVIEPI